MSRAVLVVYLSETHALQVREWEIQAKRLFLPSMEKPTASKLDDLVSDGGRKPCIVGAPSPHDQSTLIG